MDDAQREELKARILDEIAETEERIMAWKRPPKPSLRTRGSAGSPGLKP